MKASDDQAGKFTRLRELHARAGAFARAALGTFVRAARDVRDHGTLEALPDAEAAAFMAHSPRPPRPH